jgi:hypothetical protein
MDIEPLGIIALGAFLFGVLRYMKAKRKTVAYLAFGVSFLFLIASLARRSSGDKGKTSQINQSITAPVGSNNYQVGGNFTIFNINRGSLSDEEVQANQDAVTAKLLSRMRHLTDTYQHGYVIFGLTSNGQPITSQPRLRDMTINVNWASLKMILTDPSKQIFRISIPSMMIYYAGNPEPSMSWNNQENLQIPENQPVGSTINGGMYYEILDFKERILAIGFK